MAGIERTAITEWEGGLADGSGTVGGTSSGAVEGLPVTWASRVEAPEGRTSPEELVAAAHASCFAMAFSFGLANAGTPPQRLEVSATVTFDKVGDGFKVVSSALTVKGKVPGLDQASFAKAAEAAKDGCPISSALKGNVQLSVEPTLES